MKTFFKSMMIIAAAAMTFTACNKANVEIPQNEDDFYYTFILGDPATRSILSSDENGKFGAWEDGDRLGTAIDDANPGYAYVTTSTTPTTFRIYKKDGLSGGEKVYAYYPYSSAASSVSEIPFEIPAGQNQNGDSFDFDAMPMVAEEFVVPASYASTNNNTEVGEISLVNLGSVIDFQVYSSNETYAAETILSVKLVAGTPVAGSFSKDITTVDFSTESTLAISGFSGTEVITTVANAPIMGADRANAAHVYMVVAPTSGVTGSVIVKTNKAEYTYSLSTAQTFKRAGLKSFGLNLGTCQNRVSEEINTTTFVFNTEAGIQALGLELPAASAGTNVERVVSDYIVLTGETGTSTYYPRVWNSNGTYNYRVNKNNIITFSISEGTIKSISFEASAFYLSTDEGTLSGTNWEGSASSVTFTNSNAGRTDINTITVSYTGGVAPIEPVNLVMSDITCDNAEENENTLTFSWTAVENAEGYQVSIDGGSSYGDIQTALSYTWEGLNAGRQYTIYVKAVGDGTNYLTSEAKSQTGKTKTSDTPVEGPSVGDELFSTDFGTAAVALSSYTGGSSYNDASTITYTASNATYVKIDTGSAGNMTSANLFIGGKNGGAGLTATIAGIKTYGATKVTVTWAANNANSTLTVPESSTEGVASANSASNSATFDLAGTEETISLVFTGKGSNNTRVDNVKVVFAE